MLNCKGIMICPQLLKLFKTYIPSRIRKKQVESPLGGNTLRWSEMELCFVFLLHQMFYSNTVLWLLGKIQCLPQCLSPSRHLMHEWKCSCSREERFFHCKSQLEQESHTNAERALCFVECSTTISKLLILMNKRPGIFILPWAPSSAGPVYPFSPISLPVINRSPQYLSDQHDSFRSHRCYLNSRHKGCSLGLVWDPPVGLWSNLISRISSERLF